MLEPGEKPGKSGENITKALILHIKEIVQRIIVEQLKDHLWAQKWFSVLPCCNHYLPFFKITKDDLGKLSHQNISTFVSPSESILKRSDLHPPFVVTDTVEDPHFYLYHEAHILSPTRRSWGGELWRCLGSLTACPSICVSFPEKISKTHGAISFILHTDIP